MKRSDAAYKSCFGGEKKNPLLIGELDVGKIAIIEVSVFHRQCLLQTAYRLWNWDIYIK
jgi:hypothetical protein